LRCAFDAGYDGFLPTSQSGLPSVTFVIPVRDDAQRLSICLQSIAQNNYPRHLVETIVVDNGSTDGSDLVASRAGAIVLSRPGDAVAKMRNDGAAMSRHAILAFVDADHQIDANWLRALADCMVSPRIAAAGAPYTAPSDGTWVQRLYGGLREHHDGPREIDWLGSGNIAVRRSVFEALHGFDSSLVTCEDVDLCERLRAAGHVILCDEDLKSVHLGDPETLKGLFFSELWRGRDNLRATLRGPKDLRHLRSVLVPFLYLSAIVAGAAGPLILSWESEIALLGAVLTPVGISSVRARYLIRRTGSSTVLDRVRALAVACTYDLARALALVVHVGHRTRRFADGTRRISPSCPMPSPTPRVSFIIPVRDDAMRLSRCLESISGNDYPRDRVEVIVVDNESVDGSDRIARDARADVVTARHQRVSALRNAGAAVARGDILAFVDADHEIDSGWIRRAVATLADDRVAATGAPSLAPSDGNWVQHRYDGLRPRVTHRRDVEWLGSGNFAVKCDVFRSLEGFDESIETCEDVDLCRRLRASGHRIVCDAELRSLHFGDPSSLSELFLGELWRGRDNVRVSFRRPWTFRALRSAFVPIVDLAAIGIALYGAATGSAVYMPIALTIVLGFAALKAAQIIARDPSPNTGRTVQSFVVALVYDLARALAPIMRVSHRLRRRRKAPRSVATT
jgi:glycosyltransferase involved in cell wall biosynthesis